MKQLSGPPYKDKQNRWLTVALFLESSRTVIKENKYCEPVFTLHEDVPGLVNFRRTFVELEDPTGYKWAIQYLGDYEHWKKLLSSNWFNQEFEAAKDELELKMKSEALAVIKQISQNVGDKQALPAARYLASGEYNKKAAGRPSREAVSGELKRQVQRLTVEDEDLARIRLVK